jgi:hypothetical protein
MSRQLTTTRNKEAAVWHLIRRSPAARTLSTRQSEITLRLRSDKTKVWSIARVARLFEISERLLWKWIADGCIRRYRRPTRNHRKGITATAICGFLSHLHGCASYSVGFKSNRTRRAEDKCRELANRLQPEEQLTPQRFAARAGVSTTTVHRLLGTGLLFAKRPSPHRAKICHPSEKFRKNRLTGKKGQTAH